MWRRRSRLSSRRSRRLRSSWFGWPKEQGLSLTGPDGLLKQLTKTVLETALNEEMTEHLGYEKHDPPEAGTGNVRNGTRSKTVLTDTTGRSRSMCRGIGPRRSNRRSCKQASTPPVGRG